MDEANVMRFRARREEIIGDYRQRGTFQTNRAAALANDLRAFVSAANGAIRAQAQLELATILRMSGEFREAIPIYYEAAASALAHGDRQTAFEAEIGIARAHGYGTKDHGAAAAAFARAVAIAGNAPSPAQRYALADYGAQLEAGRGDLDAALLNALDARRLAVDDGDRFYAELAVGDALQKFAESCDYRKLADARTGAPDDDADGFGACRRAVHSAEAAYAEAQAIGEALGWSHLATEAKGFRDRLAMRLLLIEQRAQFQQVATSNVFAATAGSDVLVNADFAAGASELGDHRVLATLIEHVVGVDGEDARSLYLLGQKADLEGRQSEALLYYQRAVARLEAERASMFDLRRRGTVVESRPELVRDLALRLLALGRPEDAFKAFESIRARGLGELANAFAAAGLNEGERRWLARLTELESRKSALLSKIVETTIAGMERDGANQMTAQLDAVQDERRAHLSDTAFAATQDRLRRTTSPPASLETLHSSVRLSGIPVILYWVTATNILVWIVAPDAMEIKTVFLPEVALTDKVERLVRSVRTADEPLDERAAQQLHAYLLQPFAHHLADGRVLVVPQGPLVTLPFETLLHAETGRFLVEDLVVSYAPNASFAVKALQTPPPQLERVSAVFDADLAGTGEIDGIARTAGIRLEQKPTADLTHEEAMAAFASAPAVHVLLHGQFDTVDPLQSTIDLNLWGGPREESLVTAAELLAVDWRDTDLAVFSACEGAQVNRRISNEVYGLSWPLFVGGVRTVLMNRWRVEARHNAVWMNAFYSRLAQGDVSPADAAAAAMRTRIAGGARHPYVWAGPQLFGR